MKTIDNGKTFTSKPRKVRAWYVTGANIRRVAAAVGGNVWDDKHRFAIPYPARWAEDRTDYHVIETGCVLIEYLDATKVEERFETMSKEEFEQRFEMDAEDA